MYSFQQQGEAISPEEIARLLRGVGASGRFVGFNYVVFIIYRILQNPGEYYWLTKCAYPEAAKHFGVRPASVEHAIRTLIAYCWSRSITPTLTGWRVFTLRESPPTASSSTCL